MEKNSFLSGCALLVLLAGLGAACQQRPALSATPAANSATAASPALTQNPEDDMPRINVQDAKAAFDKGEAVLVDVRGIDAYRSAHIKGAIDHSLSKLEQGDFKGLPNDKRIIAYCSCPTEHSSARAALVLHKAGFKEAAALVGGNMAWEAAGYEMVKTPLSLPSPAVSASPSPKAQQGNLRRSPRLEINNQI